MNNSDERQNGVESMLWKELDKRAAAVLQKRLVQVPTDIGEVLEKYMKNQHTKDSSKANHLGNRKKQEYVGSNAVTNENVEK